MSPKPERTCVACRSTSEKANLIKYVADPEGGLVCDIKGKLPGRGAYLCGDMDCAKTAVKKKSFAKVLDVELKEFSVDELKEMTLKALKTRIYGLLRAAKGASERVESSPRVAELLKENAVKFLLIPTDASKDTVGKIISAANKNSIRVLSLDNKIDTAIALHRPVRAAFALTDSAFAKEIEELAVKIDIVNCWT